MLRSTHEHNLFIWLSMQYCTESTHSNAEPIFYCSRVLLSLPPPLSSWPQCLLPTNRYSSVELWPLWKALEHVSVTITLHKLKACKEWHSTGQVKAYWRSLKLGYDMKGIINCIFLLQFHSHSSLLEEHLPILKLLWSISMWSIHKVTLTKENTLHFQWNQFILCRS